MNVNDLVKIINEIGFPIFVSTVLIIRVDKKLQTIINVQQIILERMREK